MLEKLKNIFIRTPRWLLITVFILAVIRLILPYVGLRTINWALANKLGTYDGRIQDFDLSLYRGAYQLQGLQIKKKDSDLPPILAVNEIDLSVAWRTLLTGKIAADVVVDRMVIHMMDSNKEEKKQFGNDEPGAKEALGVVVPVSVESIIIKNSAFYFTNNDLKALPIQIESIYGKVEDLLARARKPSESLSPFELEGVAMTQAKIKINGKVDALATPIHLDINFSLEDFHPKTVNALLLTYVPLDLTQGEISLYGEAATSKGDVKGYVNLFLKDVDVVAPNQKLISLKHFFVEIASAAANWILKTKEQKTVAAHIPFSRSGGKFDIGYGEAFSSAIDNRKNPMKKGFDNSISLKSLEGEK